MKFLLIGLAAIAAAMPLAGVATAAPSPPDVPPKLAVDEGNKPFLIGHAVGVQIYGCNGTSWTLIAPRANLYGDNGQLIATHFAGPSWRSTDGSTVVGRRIADPVIVDETAIPWLLIAQTSATDGRLAQTTYIQRVATTGGLAPTSPCTAGDTVEVDYTADYVFWKKAS